MHEITWSDVKVSEGPIKGKNYLLTLTYRNQVEKLIVYPTLSDENFDKAEKKYQKKFADYEVMVEKRNADEKRLIAEMEAKQKAYLGDIAKKKEEYAKERRLLEDRSAAIDQKNLENSFSSLSNNVKALRVFSISRFGIYNSDCPHGMQTGKSVNPIFVLNGKENFIIPDAIFVVDHNTKMVLTVSAKDGFKINYDPFTSYSICIFKNTKLYVCNKEAFRTTVDKDGNKFVISEIGESKDNLFDLKKALEII